MVRVAVIGAGINGLACAVKIKEKFENLDVILISKEFSPNTTSDGAAGLWYPYHIENTPIDKISKWGIGTYRFIHQLWLQGTEGICVIPAYFLYKNQGCIPLPAWRSKVFGFHQLDKKHLGHLSELYSNNYQFGYCFTTFTAESSMLLPYFMQRFKNAGGMVRHATVNSVHDRVLDEFQVVINCTGLRTRQFVSDPELFPIRGQIARVKAPWMNEIIMDQSGDHYIIPNTDCVVLGGTHQRNDYNTTVDEEDIDFILNGCKRFVPGLEKAEIIKHWVGLRPARNEIRLEAEKVNGKLWIHNYGHGGSGLTLFWGCAAETMEILNKALPSLENVKNTEPTSKL